MPLSFTEYEQGTHEFRIAKATSISEVPFESHSIPVGTVVEVVRAQDKTYPPVKKWYFLHTAVPKRYCAIRAVADMAGMVITVQIIIPDPDIDPAVWAGEEVFVGPWIDIIARSGCVGRHFAGMITNSNTVGQHIVPTTVEVLDGRWRVNPYSKRTQIVMDNTSRLALSDCQPILRA
ncbi:MAG: hypothetical protein IIB77_07840 [Proteobacteria bacterium]|nr:hypothetical protein [Pseudomonadota bacterium]